jgi:chromosome segregation ATPase
MLAEIDHLQSEVSRLLELANTQNTDQAELQRLEEQNRVLSDLLPEFEEQNNALRHMLGEQSQELTSTKQQIGERELELELRVAENDNLRMKLRDAGESAQHDLEEITRQLHTLQFANQELEQELELTKSELRQMESKLAERNEELRRLKEKVPTTVTPPVVQLEPLELERARAVAKQLGDTNKGQEKRIAELSNLCDLLQKQLNRQNQAASAGEEIERELDRARSSVYELQVSNHALSQRLAEKEVELDTLRSEVELGILRQSDQPVQTRPEPMGSSPARSKEPAAARASPVHQVDELQEELGDALRRIRDLQLKLDSAQEKELEMQDAIQQRARRIMEQQQQIEEQLAELETLRSSDRNSEHLLSRLRDLENELANRALGLELESHTNVSQLESAYFTTKLELKQALQECDGAPALLEGGALHRLSRIENYCVAVM